MNDCQKIPQAIHETARTKTAQETDINSIVQAVRQTREDVQMVQREGITLLVAQEHEESKSKARNRVHDVMVGIGEFEERVVHITQKHPQVGYMFYEGKKHQVCVGFWVDEPVWKLVEDDDEEYTYCLHKTMRIDEDPDYCGEGEEGKEHSVQPQHATIGTTLLTIDDEDFLYGYHEGYSTCHTYHHNEEGVATSTLLFLLKNGWDTGHSDQWNTGYIVGWLAAFYEQGEGQLALSTDMTASYEQK